MDFEDDDNIDKNDYEDLEDDFIDDEDDLDVD